MQTVATDATIELPPKAKCPICGEKVVFEGTHCWERDDADGTWYATEVSINCVTEPDIDSEDWEDWHNGHWNMPYVDWLPLTQAVLVWLKRNYRFVIEEGR